MIQRYTINNFKNHAHSIFEFSNLNILTGINGMGKSSVMQSMLLLRDSFSRNQMMDRLFLDGISFKLGGSVELLNRNVEEEPDKLCLCIDTENKELNFRYVYPLVDSSELEIDGENPTIEDLKEISLFNDNFQYLSAFRSGPQDFYDSDASLVDRHRQVSKNMGAGELAVYYLNKFGNEDIVISELRHLDTVSLSLYSQVEGWMKEISNGIQLKIDQKDKRIELSFGYERPGRSTTYHRAMNTGYGISFVLPIIVAILSAKPGALILIENPEAHIHPSGQAALMRLITLAAEHGVQILIETHSDHIINGALVNVKQNNLSKEALAIYYFDHDEELNASPVKLNIGHSGRIQDAPKGFFDQMSIDLKVLYGL
ncbi:hypothetical protein HMPREF3034_01548 [Prevotella sp. DNF00663]|uniref:DUF3696 domain-containing protein n=1 Tax=unclassified Prevotella TaxID=2638335 RepID=UPI000513D65A|nr:MULTISPECIES: DUF3696 domain-containing protein [unclassified Prevotella]KGI60579.1 hypothetical protein HMPREF0671_05085 [Prevotella sp. S7 MS 2]KXB82544.1 hypothetical protein HMPREF3034_01548 [Prevotella sp. DNF00663]